MCHSLNHFNLFAFYLADPGVAPVELDVNYDEDEALTIIKRSEKIYSTPWLTCPIGVH